MSKIECCKCEYYESRKDYCYVFKMKSKDMPCEMNEALKKTFYYQMNELNKAIEDFKKCIKDELIELMLKIKRFIKINLKNNG